MSDTDHVSKVVILSKTNRFLILRVSMNDKYLGQWDLPGGHLIVGENPEDGLIRETYEETGLIIKNPTKMYVEGKVTFYFTKMPVGTIKLSEEHDKYKFLRLEQIEDYDISDKFRRAINKAFDLITI